MKWSDAIALAQANAAKQNGKAADGTAQLTRRDASGLILFGRDAHKLLESKTVRTNFPSANFRASTFDWYAWSLPTLGWFKRGDKFRTDDKWEKAPLDPTTATALWAGLVEQAKYLDDAGVPFKMVRDPRGTPATFKTLAMDAYRKMQQLDPKSADVHPHKKPSKSDHHPGKPHPTSDNPTHPSQTVQPPTIVIPPPITVDHPDGGTVTVQPPPIVVPPSVPAPAPPPPPGTPQGDGSPAGVDYASPPVITPPPIIVPPRQPGGAPLVVQPPPVVAHPINAPKEVDPYDWYWRKHANDPAHQPQGGSDDGSDGDMEPQGKKKPKPKPDADTGGGAGILFIGVLIALALTD